MKKEIQAMNYFCKLITLVIFVCIPFLCPLSVLAEDIRFEASVNPHQALIDSVVQLNLTIYGTQKVDPLVPLTIDDFDVQYLGPFQKQTIVNGQVSQSISFVYNLFPKEVGRFTIPSFKINISGKDYVSSPLSVEIINPPSPGTPNPQTSQGPLKMEDRIFLTMKTSKEEAFVYERIPISLFLLVNDLSVNDVNYPEIQGLGFELEEYSTPKQFKQVINGIPFDIVQFDTAIYPTRTGEINIGPAQVQCNLLIKSSNQRSRSGPFGDSFFDSFFNRYQERPMTVSSPGLSIKALSLPDDGKPKGFSGAVGQYSFQASISPSEVNVGDPLTLKMSIQGQGDLTAIDFPQISETKDLKVYDPTIKQEGQTKTLEQVLIPNSTKINEIPAIYFSYFDPSLKKYMTIQKGPFNVTVNESSGQDEIKVVGLSSSERDIKKETLGQDIVFIKDSPGYIFTKGNLFSFYLRNFILILLGLSVWTVLYIRFRITHKLETDVVYAKRMKAPKEAKKGLEIAQRYLSQKNPEAFYNALFKTLQRYLGNKLQLSYGIVTYEHVKEKLSPVLRNMNLLENIRTSFEEFDIVRYASAQYDLRKMQGSYARVENIIDQLERELK